jgi:hypothetical protein
MVRGRTTLWICVALAALTAGCVPGLLQPREAVTGTAGPTVAGTNGTDGANGATERRSRARARDAAAAHPLDVRANGNRAETVRERALNQRGMRILVSTEGRALWLMRDDDVVFSAPVAVGMSEPFFYDGRRYDFQTPIGERRVLAKSTDPEWVPPDWHYFEKVVARELEPVHLRQGMRVTLGDGTRIEVRGDQVGRVNQHGNFWPFTPGYEIIFEGKIFIPPFGTAQRRIPEVLGTRKLELGDGYLIHGTNQDDSIGAAVSHGCVRMYNEDVEKLYGMVPVGTRVYVF